MSSYPSSVDRGQILRVAVPTPLRRSFDYLYPENFHAEAVAGARVRIPFGRRKLIGIVVETAQDSNVEAARLKPALEILDQESLFPPGLFATLLWAAAYYQHPIGEVLATALPAALRGGADLQASEEIWQPEAGPEALASLGRARRQAELLRFLVDRGCQNRDQVQAAGFSPDLLRSLERRGLVSRHRRPLGTAASASESMPVMSTELAAVPELNAQQRAALDVIDGGGSDFNAYLLDGVTGSGKTEVYLQAMAKHLQAGRQCLMLLPEIGLTPQAIARLRQRFRQTVVVLHSGLTDQERLAAWRQARDGSAGIVIGTRSAVFTPLAHPGLIVIDEEHDGSFKQQDGFRYSARDLALVRARQEAIPVILGSATPSLESLHNAGNGKFQRLVLDQRAEASRPSRIELVDTSRMALTDGLSETAMQQMRQQLDAGNQVLVFINRRGFAPILHCLDCGWVAECENCQAQMTVHAQPAALRCHHCERRLALPRHCPACSGRELSTLGLGTQKLEQSLARSLAPFPVLRVDRDSTRGKQRLQQMLARIDSGEACVLLGTQMLAKGHHFPNLTLVVIVDADSGLFSADFRGQEHMAQTIVQVAGRAGRAERPGHILLQTGHASHELLQAIAQQNYAGLAELLLQERRQGAMPPYTHLVQMRAEAPAMSTALDFLDTALQQVNTQLESSNVQTLGPMPAPMEKRAGRFRAQLLLKSASRGNLQQTLGQLLDRLEPLRPPARLRWSLDVDPTDLI